MSENIYPTSVRHESERLYRNVWEFNVAFRRELYKYEVPPWENRQPYDIWQDIASKIDLQPNETLLDLGTGDAHFIKTLLHAGYRGKMVGVDTQSRDLPSVELLIKREFPDANVSLKHGDAQMLDIADNSFDKASGLFLAYHVARPSRVFSEAHRVVKPGGMVVFSCRGLDNQKELWEQAGKVAKNNGYILPVAPYFNFPPDQMRQSLSQTKKFRIIREHIQETEELWIPGNTMGWGEFALALYSLFPYMKSESTGKPLSEEEETKRIKEEAKLIKWIEEKIQPLFKSRAAQSGGYFLDKVHQGYFLCEVIKPKNLTAEDDQELI